MGKCRRHGTRNSIGLRMGLVAVGQWGAEAAPAWQMALATKPALGLARACERHRDGGIRQARQAPGAVECHGGRNNAPAEVGGGRRRGGLMAGGP